MFAAIVCDGHTTLALSTMSHLLRTEKVNRRGRQAVPWDHPDDLHNAKTLGLERRRKRRQNCSTNLDLEALEAEELEAEEKLDRGTIKTEE